MAWCVVLADDHPIILLGCRVIIEHGGLKVADEARNSSELMQILSRIACDVLITDFARHRAR